MKRFFSLMLIFMFLSSTAFADCQKSMPKCGCERDPCSDRCEFTPPTCLCHLNGLYVLGGVGMNSLQASDSTNRFTTSLGADSTVSSHIDSRNGLNFNWNVGLGWMFYSYAALQFDYMHLDAKMLSHQNTINSTTSFVTSTTNWNIHSDVFLASGYINLPPLFHILSTRVVPYVGAGIGYVCHHTSHTRIDNNFLNSTHGVAEANDNSDLAYQIALGWYYVFNKYFLLNFKYSYLDTGHSKLGKNFVFNVNQGTGTILSGRKVRMKSTTFQINLNIFLY